MDLCLANLAYAKRKVTGLGFTNLEHFQADILNLDQIEREFQVIECVIFLHHVKEAMAAWTALSGILQPGDLMRIGLYSELARHRVVKIRDEISLLKLEKSVSDIRKCRQSVIELHKEHHQEILKLPDSFSISSLRDLIFHVHEDRSTIPKIQYCLNQLGLEFCSFDAPNIVQHFKLAYTDVGDPYDLDKWNFYEKANPNTFSGMYQFWYQKIVLI